MIYTITLNPAIDKMVVVPEFAVDTVNRVQKIQMDPGGKGINVTKMVDSLGGQSTAIMVTGGHTGMQLEEALDKMAIKFEAFHCKGDTRINTKVVDEVNHTFTDINEPGPKIETETIEAINLFIDQNVKTDDVVVLAGSIPAGVPTDIYQRWSNMARINGAKVILDADGEVFAKGLKGKPFLIKPNEDEIAAHFGTTFKSQEDLIHHVRILISKGITYVVVSQGADGCLLVGERIAVKFDPIRVKVKSTVGAGDSMVAAIALGLSKESGDLDYKMADIVALGVAASSASIEREGTIMGDKDRVRALVTEVKYKNI